MDKQTLVAEIKRVAEAMQTQSLSRSTFQEQGTISAATVEATFGSWNEAVKEAGLIPLPQGGLPKSETKRRFRLQSDPQTQEIAQSISDEEALQDLVRLTKELGRRPSGNQISAKGHHDPGVYKKRWGSITAACEAAYIKYGDPLQTEK